MGQERARANQLTGDLNDTLVSLEMSVPSSPGFPSLTNLEAISLVWGKTKFSGQLTACWHLPRKGGASGLVPVPPASLIYRGEMPLATAPRRARQISLEAQILAHSLHWETGLLLDGEGADGGHGPHGVG